MNNDINEKIVHAAPVPPFVRFVASAVPMVFDNSLSYYEALCALWKWLQDDVIDVINNNASVTEQYIEYDLHTRELFIELKNYVDTYFDNLDVQEEINNKLDAMAEDGTLQEIITTYIQSNVAWTFDTVADMKAATNLVDGSYAQTLGFHNLNDGGGATYFITDSGSANEMDVIAVDNLYAVLVPEDVVNVKQLGAYGDATTDDTTVLQYAIDYGVANSIHDVILPKGTYVFTTLTIKQNMHLIGEGGTLFVKGGLCTDNTHNYYIISMNDNSVIKNVEINGNKENNTQFMVADIITTYGDNITIDGCHFYNVIDSAIMYSESAHSVISNCRIDDARDCGIYCNNNNSDKILDSVIMNNYIKNAGASGISMKRGCRYIDIRNNYLLDCLNGITNEQANTNTDFSKEFTIIGNTIKHSTVGSYGIDTRCGYNSIVSGNRVENYYEGILCQGSHDLNINSNIILFAKDTSITQNAHGILLTGRNVTGFNKCYNINVNDNIIDMSFADVSAYQQACIRVNSSDNTSNISICNNRFKVSNGGALGSTTNVNGMTIIGNTFDGTSGQTAVGLQGSNLYVNNTVITGNELLNKPQYFAKDGYHRYFTNGSNNAPVSTTDYNSGDVIFAKSGAGSIFAWVYDSGSNYKHVNYDA